MKLERVPITGLRKPIFSKKTEYKIIPEFESYRINIDGIVIDNHGNRVSTSFLTHIHSGIVNLKRSSGTSKTGRSREILFCKELVYDAFYPYEE